MVTPQGKIMDSNVRYYLHSFWCTLNQSYWCINQPIAKIAMYSVCRWIWRAVHHNVVAGATSLPHYISKGITNTGRGANHKDTYVTVPRLETQTHVTLQPTSCTSSTCRQRFTRGKCTKPKTKNQTPKDAY